MGLFERFLTVWVALGIAAGVMLGLIMPGVFEAIALIEFAHVNLIVAVLIWIMIYPMMIQIDWSAVKDIHKKPQGLILTLVINWLVKPFTMAALGVLFFQYLFAPWVDPQSAQEYIAGMILLGVAPCTAMVFVWSQLVNGDRCETTTTFVSVVDVRRPRPENDRFATPSAASSSIRFDKSCDQSQSASTDPLMIHGKAS